MALWIRKSTRNLIGAASFGLATIAMGADDALLNIANSKLLPEKFTVGVIGDAENPQVVNHTGGGMLQAAILPTVNGFTGTPGCYVACYSRCAENAAYNIGSGIFVMGQFRLEGEYGKNPKNARICEPKGFEGRDISIELKFNEECTRLFPEACPDNSCWVGGDTGGWFGIQ